MMTKPCRRHNRGPAARLAPTPPAPVSMPSAPPSGEPVMRRWPHPVEPPAPPPAEDLHNLLRRQTELLLEIRTLLVRLTAEGKPRE